MHRKLLAIVFWTSVFVFLVGLLTLVKASQHVSGQGSQIDGVFWSAKQNLLGDQPYDILLLSRQFTPVPGIEPALAQDVIDRVGLESGRRHVLLQLYGAPKPEELIALRSMGIKLLNYIPHNAWFASMPAGDVATTLEESYVAEVVRWAGMIRPEDRVSSDVRAGLFGDWAIAEQDRVRLAVSFFDDVSSEFARLVVSRHGGVTEREVAISNKFAILLQLDEIPALAAEDTVRWIDQVSPPPVLHNDGARAAVDIDTIQAAPYSLSGQGVVAGIWDGGAVDWNHDDFDRADGTSRVISRTAAIADHATHVAGTMAGNGARSQAAGGMDQQWRGMAPQMDIISYDFYDPVNDYAEAIGTYGIDLSQNSWGWDFDVVPCDRYGDYSGDAPDFDRVVTGQNGKPILVVFSAGNERGYTHCPTYKPYGNVTPSGGTAKNAITVGAVNSNNQSMTNFSSWGPVDDGRLKPEVVAPGCQTGGDGGVNSAIPDQLFTNDSTRDCDGTGDDYCYPYDIMCGTSMAAPVVSGISALLIEQYQETYDDDLWPSAIKALLVQSAHDLDDGTSWYNPGPDFASGYGLVDAKAAVDLVRAQALRQDSISNSGEGDLFYVWVPTGTTEIKVSLAWDDPAAVENAASTLVNDLDLLLWSPLATHMPWILDPANPTADATQIGRDDVNNLEQVFVENPMPGMWTIVITGTAVQQGPQNYSIASESIFDILKPRQGAQVFGGSARAPRKVVIETAKPRDGLTKGQFDVTIGGLPVTVVTSYEGSNSYVLEVLPTQPPANGSYDLSVMVPAASVWNVRENGVLFADENNVDVDLVLDRSGSMGTDKMNDAKEAAKQFVDLMHNDDMVGVVSFDDVVETGYPLTAITSSSIQEEAKNAIDLLYARGMTSIGGGLERGQQQLATLGNASHPWAIVLLSDGLENTAPYVADVLPTIASSKTVVHTIGLGTDADEPLMQEIAAETRGTYNFAPGPDELAWIYNTIAGAVSGQQVLFSETGTLQAGSTDEKDVVVDSTVSEATFSISWSNSSSVIDLTLERPNGTIIDPGVASSNSKIEFVSGSTYQYYRVQDPPAGVWKMHTSGGYIPFLAATGTETYNAIVTGEAELTLQLYVDRHSYLAYEPVRIVATLSDYEPIKAARISCVVEAPSSFATSLNTIPWVEIDGELVPEPRALAQLRGEVQSPASTFLLYDDGKHEDGVARDGVYGNVFGGTSNEGTYQFSVSASGASNTGEDFSRQATAAVYVAPNPGRIQQVYLPLVLRAHQSTPTTWLAGSGLAGRSVYGLAVSPTNCNVVYAATDAGVYKSTDGGVSWSQTTLRNLLAARAPLVGAPPFAPAGGAAATATLISAVATHPSDGQVVYAATWGSGVHKSTDGGASWSPTNDGLDDLWLYAIAADPGDGQVLYVGTNSGGVYKTTTGGSSWVKASSGLGNLEVRSLAVAPSDGQVLYAGTRGGIFASATAGSSWSACGAVGSGDPWALAIHPTDPRVTYAALGGGGVFLTRDGGMTWSAANGGLGSLDMRALVIDFASPKRLYAGTNGGGVYTTTDGGTSWRALNDGLGDWMVKSLSYRAGCGIIHAGTTTGAWRYGP